MDIEVIGIGVLVEDFPDTSHTLVGYTFIKVKDGYLYSFVFGHKRWRKFKFFAANT
jgi:hypothetical protein